MKNFLVNLKWWHWGIFTLFILGIKICVTKFIPSLTRPFAFLNILNFYIFGYISAETVLKWIRRRNKQ